MTPTFKDWLAVLAFGAFVAWSAPALILDAAEHELARFEEPGATCTTDTDCMQKHCPPPADDAECDGGPRA